MLEPPTSTFTLSVKVLSTSQLAQGGATLFTLKIVLVGAAGLGDRLTETFNKLPPEETVVSTE